MVQVKLCLLQVTRKTKHAQLLAPDMKSEKTILWPSSFWWNIMLPSLPSCPKCGPSQGHPPTNRGDQLKTNTSSKAHHGICFSHLHSRLLAPTFSQRHKQGSFERSYDCSKEKHLKPRTQMETIGLAVLACSMLDSHLCNSASLKPWTAGA